jgi:hypothetical protein
MARTDREGDRAPVGRTGMRTGAAECAILHGEGYATTPNDDDVLLELVLRLARAHVKRAEEALAGLRGRGRGQFMDERRAELEAIQQRLAKAATVRPSESTLDLAHNLMREIERIHDSIVAAVTGVEAEMSRWMSTAGAT